VAGYLAFLTSFATILIMWINRHRMFTLVGRSDDRLMFYNGLLLLGVTVVPFPTSLVAEYLRHDGERVAALVFNGTYIFIAICFNLLWRSIAVRNRLLHRDADPAAVQAIFDAYRFGPLSYIVAFALAFVSVTSSLVFNLALAIFYGVPHAVSRGRFLPDALPDLATHSRSARTRPFRRGRSPATPASITGSSGTPVRRGASSGPADGPHLPALSSSAEESIAAIGLEPRYAHTGRHLEPVQDLSRSGVDSPHIALVAFPGAVPEFSVDPGDPGDEAVGLDRTENRPCLRIDLMDLPVAILSHPERAFGPRESRVTAAAGCRDRGEHTASRRIDLLDAIFGELKQVLAVERRSCMRRDIDRAQRLPARRIKGP
jgi:TMEM175 potassium channel family protein